MRSKFENQLQELNKNVIFMGLYVKMLSQNRFNF